MQFNRNSKLCLARAMRRRVVVQLTRVVVQVTQPGLHFILTLLSLVINIHFITQYTCYGRNNWSHDKLFIDPTNYLFTPNDISPASK